MGSGVEQGVPGHSESEDDDVREVSPGLWTSGPSLVELDAYGDYAPERRGFGLPVDEKGT